MKINVHEYTQQARTLEQRAAALSAADPERVELEELARALRADAASGETDGLTTMGGSMPCNE